MMTLNPLPAVYALIPTAELAALRAVVEAAKAWRAADRAYTDAWNRGVINFEAQDAKNAACARLIAAVNALDTVTPAERGEGVT